MKLRKVFSLYLLLLLCLTGLPALAESTVYTPTAESGVPGIELPSIKNTLSEKGTVRLKLSYKKLTLEPGYTKNIGYKYWYRGSPNTFHTSSSNTSVAQSYFTNGGYLYVRAIRAGKAKITLKSGSKKAVCTVTVKAPAVSDVQLSQTEAAIARGTSLTLYATVSPAGANQKITWTSSNKKIATVMDGVVYGKKEGQARITAKAVGGLSASCVVTVTAAGPTPEPAGNKALLIGMSQQAIIGKYNLSALPSIPYELTSVRSMFAARGVTATQILNQSKAQVLSAIRSAFAGSAEGSVNYLYGSSHGGIEGSTVMLYLATDQYISASELRSLLDDLPGAYVIMLNECQSGGAIGKGTENFARRFADAFTVKAKLGELAAPKYHVLCAAKSDESAIIWSNANSPQTAEDLFAYAFLDAVGWRLHGGETGAWGADANGDGKATMAELAAYIPPLVEARNRSYASASGNDYAQQTVVTYSADPDFAVLSK